MVASPCRRHIQAELVADALRRIAVEIEAAAEAVGIGLIVFAEGIDAVNGVHGLPIVRRESSRLGRRQDVGSRRGSSGKCHKER